MSETQGCPGSRMMDRRNETPSSENAAPGNVPSELKQWPVQMHLISPQAPYFQGADVILCADCVAFARGAFHGKHLKGKSIGIACPKLDEGQDVYVEKIKAWIDDAKINTLSVMIMEVPCCMGLVNLAKQGADAATRKVPLKLTVVGLDGEIRKEEWL
ncbi:MAG: 4Fe-4S ferredoxin [Planctomycetes bacterium]|nr:4Fe-4S ferredoxin [Planctomycetota bacterium]